MTKILLADDERELRGIYSNFLAILGHEVTEAVDGRDALDRLNGNPNTYGLIVTDVNMPRMDGIQLVQAAKESGYSGPILVATGRPNRRTDALTDMYGVPVLTKPMTMKSFSAAVQELTGTIDDKVTKR